MGAFEHEAMFYEGDDGFVKHCAAFVREGVRIGEPCLVAVLPYKIDLLREELGSDAEQVLFREMDDVGRNPARIIPMWREFAEHWLQPGARVRGIGEPIWASRSSEELIESQRHEELINLAFPDVAGTIMCPYDVAALAPDVLDAARRSHPFTRDGTGARTASERFAGVDEIARPFDHPLPPAVGAVSMRIDGTRLPELRAFIADRSAGLGLDARRIDDLVLAVNEVATNTVRHGDGRGELQIWSREGAVICDVRDGGVIADPLVGRHRSVEARESGLGLWIVHQLCDLVQVRSDATGTLVRMHMFVSA